MTTDMPRPPKWDSWLPDDERLPDEAWTAEPDPDWEVLPEPDPVRSCRFTSNGERCRRPAVARLNRGRFTSRYIWWHYCERHMYGRWIEGGRVLVWRTTNIAPPSSRM